MRAPAFVLISGPAVAAGCSAARRQTAKLPHCCRRALFHFRYGQKNLRHSPLLFAPPYDYFGTLLNKRASLARTASVEAATASPTAKAATRSAPLPRKLCIRRPSKRRSPRRKTAFRRIRVKRLLKHASAAHPSTLPAGAPAARPCARMPPAEDHASARLQNKMRRRWRARRRAWGPWR